jgi:hypothetical protein
MEKKGKDMGDGASSDDSRAPTKYKGFLDKFRRETMKRAEAKKE